MTNPHQLPQLTLEDFEGRFRDRHLLHGTIEKWAREKPRDTALIDSERNQRISWAAFDRNATAIARRLLEYGFQKGDRFATVLPLTSEHLFLEYACFKIGVIFAPLDLRLTAAELLRSLQALDANGLAFAKAVGVRDLTTLASEISVQGKMKLLTQFSPAEECVESAIPLADLLKSEPFGQDLPIGVPVEENEGALVIFTTGSTGSPKPALLSHRNISCQAMCISQTLLRTAGHGMVTLVNLPPSHVGCQTELLMGTLFEGGTAVLVPVFDPVRSLSAIRDYKVTTMGQIPAMFHFEWRLKDYDSYDLSSIDFIAYGGQQVASAFIDKMSSMAPNVGTGLGLTETAGFCTYIRRPHEHARDCVSTLGIAMPVYPMTIRQEMQADGSAGRELPDGELGHVCFRGPQTFLGYLNDATATAATVSTDGYLYTGDIGFRDSAGLHFGGRAKWVLKPGGYQVFPGDVETHFCALDGVSTCAAVGVEHPIISEAILAFVEKKPGAELATQALEKHARSLPSYMRPRWYVLLESGEMPLNRVGKADYMLLSSRAKQEVEILKARGQWSKD